MIPCCSCLHRQDVLMDSMDVARDPAVKMKGEDLAHAYDAVRVANKSVFFSVVSTCAASPVSRCDLCFRGCVSDFWRASCAVSAVSRRSS